jgi:hypothetical protein
VLYAHTCTRIYAFVARTDCMRLVGIITETLKASTEAANRGGTGDSSAGAYWCHDCDERIRDMDVEGDDPPDCPDCGAAMEFERLALRNRLCLLNEWLAGLAVA